MEEAGLLWSQLPIVVVASLESRGLRAWDLAWSYLWDGEGDLDDFVTQLPGTREVVVHELVKAILQRLALISSTRSAKRRLGEDRILGEARMHVEAMSSVSTTLNQRSRSEINWCHSGFSSLTGLFK